MESHENPPAFPRDHRHIGHNGMTLRDWFAGQADVSAYNPVASYEENHARAPTVNELAEYIAGIRLIEADAMLALRAKPAEPAPEPKMQHVAYFDEGQFHWMSGIAPRDCELFAKGFG